MSKRELFTLLFPREKATSGNKKYARLTTPYLQKLYFERVLAKELENEMELNYE